MDINEREEALDDPPILSGLVGDLLRATALAHERWVEDGGLRKAEMGPLNNLQVELDAAAEIARRLSRELEEEQ